MPQKNGKSNQLKGPSSSKNIKRYLRSFVKKVSSKRFTFKLPTKALRILAAILIILIGDLTIQYIFYRKVVAYSPRGIIISKEQLTERFLKSQEPTTPALLIKQLSAEQIITKEAKKEGIKVTDQDITQFLKEITGLKEVTLESLALQSGLTVEEFKEKVVYALYLNKLVQINYSPTEEEIKKYYEQNKELFFTNKKLEEVKDQIRELLINQKRFEAQSQWFEGKLKEYNMVTLTSQSSFEYRLGSGINYFLPIVINKVLETNLRAPIISRHDLRLTK